jgi:hypothetical protein
MVRRTTVAADQDDLQTLRDEARRRGTSLARLLRDLISEKAMELRTRRRPKIGIARSGAGVARESVEDEDAPARTSYRD